MGCDVPETLRAASSKCEQRWICIASADSTPRQRQGKAPSGPREVLKECCAVSQGKNPTGRPRETRYRASQAVVAGAREPEDPEIGLAADVNRFSVPSRLCGKLDAPCSVPLAGPREGATLGPCERSGHASLAY